MKIKIKRQKDSYSASEWQVFDYSGNGRETVTKILDTLNYRDDLYDENHILRRRIRWECSCMQKICGGCAMVINGVPALACSTFIDTDKTKLLTLEPLTKFPVVSDLIVDRSIIFEHLKEAELYIHTYAKSDKKEAAHQYSAAKCLKCGLCLEVCPNYVPEGENFFGAVFANDSYLAYTSSADRKEEIKKVYNKHFSSGCSKSLACRDICPANMQTLSTIAFMNKQK